MLKCHLDIYHQGVESMRHGLQQKFCKLGLRNAMRSIEIRCVPCRKYNAVVQFLIMADLPRERVEKIDFRLTYVGVEYFGPSEREHWLAEVLALKELSIDRYYGWQRGSNIQLHVFVDTSEMGLCVVAYMRFEKDDNVKVFRHGENESGTYQNYHSSKAGTRKQPLMCHK